MAARSANRDTALTTEAKRPIEVTGIGVSPGIVYGPAFMLDKRSPNIEKRIVPPEKIPEEIDHLVKAVAASRQQIHSLRRRVADMLHETHAQIYDSHLVMLQDENLYKRALDAIRDHGHCAEFAFSTAAKALAERFQGIDDPYLRARAADLDDVYQRVMDNMMDRTHEPLFDIDSPVIVVAHDLTPSDTANMIGRPVLAFVTDKGGPTSHAAIMAKALEIPAVVSANIITELVNPGDTLLIDGRKGVVIISPDEEALSIGRKQMQQRRKQETERLRLRDLPAVTRDGFRIELAANIEFPEEIPHVKAHGADSIGLFRTEFQYLNKDTLPEEEEMFHSYSQVVNQMGNKPVIFRTVDLGGDKMANFMRSTHELNPYMGLRAIRLCLGNPEMLITQLRAILRATAGQTAHIMFPMVTKVEEIREARKILAQTRRQLRSEGIAAAKTIHLGTMIEVPSAALTADVLAQEVDFFSIGTNDLIQYTLAVDRVNQKVAQLYDPLHPSVLRLITYVVEKAHEAGIWVGVCGEMAGDPMTAVLLVGLGVDELSMGSVVIPEVKALIRGITLTQAREFGREALRLPTAEQVRALVKKREHQFKKAMI